MNRKLFAERIFGRAAFGLLLSVMLALPVYGQSLVWVREDGGEEFDFGHSIAVDEAGNSYVTGSFENSATFGRGEDQETFLRADNDANTFFLAKYAENGSLLWVRRAGGDFSSGRGIALDDAGSIYVTGDFLYSAIFGIEEDNETTLLSDDRNLFVAKYDEDGTLLWDVQAGTSESSGQAIEVDEEGNSYVTGSSLPGNFGSEDDQVILDNFGGGLALFVAKYSSNSNLLWVRQGGRGSGSDIAVDVEGKIYLTGGFSGTATFGPGETDELTSSGETDIFLAKYASDGSLIWVRQAGGEGNDFASGIAVDDDGSSYMTGDFSGEATFGLDEGNQTILTSSGEEDIFVAKYASDGSLLWAKKEGTEGLDRGNGIALDGMRNSYVTGFFAGSIFIAKYVQDGSLIWFIQEESSSSVDFEFTSGRDIAANGAGNFWVTGTIDGPVTFGEGENEITLGSGEDAFEIFVASYAASDTVTAIQDLIELIEGFNLNRGIETSLIAKLRNAQKALESDNADQRRNSAHLLDAFINEVEAQSGNNLTDEQADQLMEPAEQILEQLLTQQPNR